MNQQPTNQYEQFLRNEIQCINSAGIVSKVSGYNRFSGAEIFAVLKRYLDD